MKFRTLHLAVALALLAVSGIVHGMWTNRWSVTSPLDGKNLLAGVDADLGVWKAGDFQQLNAADVPANTRNDSRWFVSSKNGKRVRATICSGSPGAVAVHTPDVCYLGAGWKIRSAVARQTIPLPDGTTALLWMADFTKASATGSDAIRVYWSWTPDGTWVAPDYPRWALARAPILYKIYLEHPLSEEEDLTREDHYRKFAADLLQALSRQLR